VNMVRRFAWAFVIIASVAAQAAAPGGEPRGMAAGEASTVFVVRHAERADDGSSGGGMMAADPDLSGAGRARAESLALMLKSANVTTIIATPYKRTQQTAAPLARALGIEITTIGARDTANLPAVVRDARGNVLIVGHSNTVPATLKELGVTTPVTLEDTEYDNLFIVTMTGTGPRMVRLHFR
jgi:phosphohistidine phosphatase SixA